MTLRKIGTFLKKHLPAVVICTVLSVLLILSLFPSCPPQTFKGFVISVEKFLTGYSREHDGAIPGMEIIRQKIAEMKPPKGVTVYINRLPPVPPTGKNDYTILWMDSGADEICCFTTDGVRIQQSFWWKKDLPEAGSGSRSGCVITGK